VMLLLPSAVHGQRAASPFLPADHWAHGALRELEMRGALGTESLDPGSRTTTVGNAIASFARASSKEGGSESIRRRAAGYAERLRAEYGEDETSPRGFAVRGGGEYENHEGRVAAGDGYYHGEDWTGARPRADINTGNALLGLDARSGALAFNVEGKVGEESRITQVQAVARVRDAQIWAGRRASAYGPALEGIVINSRVAFDGAGLALVHPVRVPSFFRGQGRLNIEGSVAKLDSIGRFNNPWFLAARLAYSPHPRFVVGINRGAMFGGDHSPVTVTKFARMLIGLYSGNASDFENQIIAFDMRYRVPGVPLVAYYEWGMDDGSGAWLDVPGITAGVTLPFEAGGAPIDITLERTNFNGMCCGNPIWYRHGRYRGSWADDGVMIGHSLGGHGRENEVAIGFATPNGALRVRVRGFMRERGDENVYAPERAGGSNGGDVELALHAMDRIEIEMKGGTEQGDLDWSETRFVIGARVRLVQRQ
jgi:hypothetical protein